ncbi:TIGR03986 family CRISPR-associated RAMP protein [Streptosporangium sp. NPDC020145]|uniref:TIGR03986 family type III CRISPR-associated RAMP protein n=1 Tax=Streptosporangium sp. NPDC020145 TaxID=3154694 RepID=UPI003443FA47
MTTGEEGFLNPYTFIPAFPRDALPDAFGDAPPPSRDRLRAGCLTGRIAVTLTVETPLLLLDTTRAVPASTGEKDHRVYPVRLRDGRPHLPATTVKGMLRAAYEAVTNSRFGVFEDHDTPFGFRREAGYALGMVPVYVAGEGTLFRLRSALFEMYDKESGENLYPDGDLHAPVHMERLRAVIKKTKNGEKVVDFAPADSSVTLTAERGEKVVSGIAYITGPNVERKRYERFLYLPPGDKPSPLPLAREWKALAENWESLIRNYRAAHDDDELRRRRTPDGLPAGPGRRVGDGPGQLAWSPHLHDEDHLRLRRSAICYARLVDGGVDRLYPVLIPRDLYPVAPAELLGEGLAPAPSYERLSPADRVFGWVAPKGAGVRPSAYRGRLRVGPVTCDGTAAETVDRFEGDGLSLAILSRPKPQQGRFYLAESRQRPQRPIKDGTPKEELYAQERGLRGRKVYWHHAGLDAGKHWRIPGAEDPAQAPAGGRHREYARSWKAPDDSGRLTRDRRRYETVPGAEQRDSQNRSINGWVRPGTVFRFTVEVRDLDEHELGALAWLLGLPEGHFHRLGFGRPLGFGSVRLAVDPTGTELHTGAEYAAYYRTLTGGLPATDGVKVLDEARRVFEKEAAASPALSTIRDAMLTVSRGDPTLPVHYPRTRPDGFPPGVPAPPDPRGRNFEWFTVNEQDEKSPRIRTKRSLPGLEATTPPLRIYPKKALPEETIRKGANGPRRKGGNKR